MARKYAKGRHALAECQRSGQKMRYRDLVEDGHVPGLLVHPDWWEPKHPQETPVTVNDPVALYRPAPELSVPVGYGDANYLWYSLLDDFERTGPAIGGDWIDPQVSIYVLPSITNGYATDELGIQSDEITAAYSPTAMPSANHFVEAELINVDSGLDANVDGFAAWLWLRASSDGAGDNSGYYCYVESYPAGESYSGKYLYLMRWDSPDSYVDITGYWTPFDADPTIPDGSVIRVEVIGNEISTYYNDQLIVTVTDNTYAVETNVGFGVESFGAATGGIDVIRAGGLSSPASYQSGTLATDAINDSRQIVVVDAITYNFGDSIHIQRDDGTWFSSYVRSKADTASFVVPFNTNFSGSATAGNAFYIRAAQ